MGWGCHPDTLSIARARSIASRTGHTEGSSGYLQAYRDAYEAGAGSVTRGLPEMLANLDAEIARRRELERTGAEDTRTFAEKQFASVGAGKILELPEG